MSVAGRFKRAVAAAASRLRRLERFGRREIGLLAALGIAAGGLWIFFAVVDEVLEGEAHAVDRAILLALRVAGDPAQPIGPSWLTIAVKDLTTLGGYTIIAVIGLLIAGYLALLRDFRRIPLIAVSFVGGLVLSQVAKGFFDRPRPDVVAHLVEVQTASLPSGHAMMSAVVYLTLGALLAQVQRSRWVQLYVIAAAVSLTVAVGLSRVYLGVHYPSDVLAGWAFGAAWAMACWLVARLLTLRQRRAATRAR